MSKSQPVHEVRLGNVRASIWANDGRHGVWFTVSFSRLYRQAGEWESTTSFGRDELPLVAKAADMAYAWIWNAMEKNDAST